MLRMALCFLSLVVLVSCKPDTEARVNSDSADRFASAERLSIPSDPGARYHVLSVSKAQDGFIEIVTRRSGPSGMAFSKRQVDCDRQTFRYLADSETFEGLANGVPSPNWSDLVTGSISWHVVQRACQG